MMRRPYRTIFVTIPALLLVMVVGFRFVQFFIRDTLGIPAGYSSVRAQTVFIRGKPMGVSATTVVALGHGNQLYAFDVNSLSQVGVFQPDETVETIIPLENPETFLIITAGGELHVYRFSDHEVEVNSEHEHVYAELAAAGFQALGTFEVPVRVGEQDAIYRVWGNGEFGFCEKIEGDLEITRFQLSNDGSHALFWLPISSEQGEARYLLYAQDTSNGESYSYLTTVSATYLKFFGTTNDLLAVFGDYSGAVMRSSGPNFEIWEELIDFKKGIIAIDFSGDGTRAFVSLHYSFEVEWCLDSGRTSRVHGIFGGNYRREAVLQTAIDWKHNIVTHVTSEKRVLIGRDRLRWNCP